MYKQYKCQFIEQFHFITKGKVLGAVNISFVVMVTMKPSMAFLIVMVTMES